MKKSIKILTIIFLMIFLIPIFSYADSRVRFNYRVSGSSSNPELGSKEVPYYTKADGSKATGADTLDSSTFSSFSIHYVNDYELGFLGGGEILLGLYQFNKSYTTTVSCTSLWIIYGTQVCSSGTALATRKASGFSRSLDLGYVYPIGEMSVGGGIALPVLGSSGELSVEWTALGGFLSGLSNASEYAAGATPTEELSPEATAFTSYFLNFGYSIDAYEVLLNYRSVSSTASTTVNESKGVGALIGANKLETSSTTTSISIGVGYLF